MYFGKNSEIFLNGDWVKATDAKANPFNQSFQYGNAVFDSLRSYTTPLGQSIFKAKEHFKRLKVSSTKLFLNLNYTEDELINIAQELLKRNNLSDAYIRVFVYTGLEMRLQQCNETNIVMMAWKWGKYFGNNQVNVMTSTFRRHDPRSVIFDVKCSGYYTNNMLANTEAKSKGFQEAVIMDVDGNVSGGASANLFYEKDGVIYTPPIGHIFPGITRKVIFDLANTLDIKIVEKKFRPEAIYEADGAFLTGTAAEVTSIKSIDRIELKKQWSDTAGFELAQAFRQLVMNKSFHNFELM